MAAPSENALGPNYSDFVFYADESGDHSLSSIDSNYPIFALALCAFNKKTYSHRIVPRFQDLKFRHFGHDSVVLHEREIRKQIGEFARFSDSSSREAFMEEIADLMGSAKFRVMAVVIDKRRIKEQLFPEHPYNISLKLCLQSAFHFLVRQGQQGLTTHFIFERRGLKEDKELELEFLRIVQGDNDLRIPFTGFRVLFSDKKSNSTGMQIADLIARPIGLKIFRPSQQNRSYEIISKKLFRKKAAMARLRGIYIL